MQGRNVRFEWVKGHAGHDLNEAADERANGAAKAYQQKQEPRRGPGFTAATTDAGATAAASAPIVAAAAEPTEPAPAAVAPAASAATPAAAASGTPMLWAEASDLLAGLDAPTLPPIDVRLTLTSDEHARLRDRADEQGVSLDEALRRLI
jgi:ribonuclease HI